MADDAAEERTRERSPSFPFIPLQKAVDRLRQMAHSHKRSPARPGMLGPTWGYGQKSSGLSQTIAALRAYGLIEDIGKGEDRKMNITDLGWRILNDTRPGAREQAIKEAALRPRLIAEYANHWVNDRPSDSHRISELNLDRGFTPEAANLFLKVFDETVSFANLTGSDNLSPSPAEPEQPVNQLEQLRMRPDANPGGRRPAHFYGEGDPLPGPVMQELPSVPRATLPLKEGVAALELPQGLSPRSIKALRAWIEVMIGLAEEEASAPDEEEKTN